MQGQTIGTGAKRSDSDLQLSSGGRGGLRGRGSLRCIEGKNIDLTALRGCVSS